MMCGVWMYDDDDDVCAIFMYDDGNGVEVYRWLSQDDKVLEI